MLAVFAVNTELDVVDPNDSFLSLRESIAAANSRLGPDEIVFSLGRDDPVTILLTGGELAITDSLKITGSGMELLTIDASGSDLTPDRNDGLGSRVFKINDDGDSQIDVAIHDMTLTGGDDDDGGSLHAAVSGFGSIELVSTIVSGNHSERRGGGLFVQLSDMASCLIIDSTISDNSTSATTAPGGGLLMQLSDVASCSIIDSVFSNNTTDGTVATGGGADISLYGEGSIFISGATFTDNSTDGTSASGGGLNLSHGGTGDVIVVASTFSGNSSDGTSADGGGFKISHSGEGDVLVTANTFSGNSSEGTGAEGGGLRIVHSGIGNVFVIDNEVADNRSRGTIASGGIAVYHSGNGQATVLGNMIARNGSNDPGQGIAVAAREGATVSVRSNTIVDNSLPDDETTRGYSSVSTIAYAGGNVRIEDNIVAGNSGGLIVSSVGRTEVHRNTIENNTSLGMGLLANGGVIHSSRNRIMRNHSDRATAAGALLQAYGSGLVSVVDSEIAENSGERLGGGVGAIVSSGGSIEIRSTTISGNQALSGRPSNSGYGGGIYARNEGGQITVDHTTISSNFVDVGGGGLYVENPSAYDVFVVHSTITNNTADADRNGIGSGGGIFGGPITLDHTLVAGNLDNGGAAHDVAGIINSRYSLVGFGAEFIGPLADNGGPTLTHALLPGSPAIDAGDPSLLFQPNEFDQRGDPFVRVFDGDGADGAVVDIGAFEVQPTVAAADFDADGDIDGDDFLILQAGLGIEEGATHSDGDTNRDGAVDGEDFVIWQHSFVGNSSSGAAAIGTLSPANRWQRTVDDVQTAVRSPGKRVGPQLFTDDARQNPVVARDKVTRVRRLVAGSPDWRETTVRPRDSECWAAKDIAIKELYETLLEKT